jgi:surface carbohydrate biosynthesis protein (TIGR04326 family)
VLEEEQKGSNWLHLYTKDELMRTAGQAAKALNDINKSASKTQCHVSLDSFIGLNVILRTLRDFWSIFSIGMRVGVRVAHTPMPDYLPNLWPLMRSDWKASMFGPSAMNNLLSLNLFEAALKLIPKQQTGVYLQENISWESGFIHAWRSEGHGHLIGTPHSTVRFWDLRYFFDKRCYRRTCHNGLPLPDRVTCNGPKMRDAFQECGYPVEDLVNVEALRYMHLSQNQRNIGSIEDKPHEVQHLLVLGDYISANIQFQMKLLEQAILLIPHQLLITVKPHPMCPINTCEFPRLRLEISREPISRLIAKCDVAYASAITSAAVDAYCAGVTIISVQDPGTLNLSPLRGCFGALFANTPEELASSLISAASGELRSKDRETFFHVDSKLTNWRKILI